MDKEIKKNDKKIVSTILYTTIGIIINSLILVKVNKLFYFPISVMEYKSKWMMNNFFVNITLSAIIIIIYSLMVFSKKDYENWRKFITIICILAMIIIPAIIPIQLRIQELAMMFD